MPNMPELQAISRPSRQTVLTSPAQPDPGDGTPASQVQPSATTEASSIIANHAQHGWMSRTRRKKSQALTTALSALVFIVSIVALWASVSSALEARKATDIAEWTSRKDFLEFCEDVRCHRPF